jgi:hypothetical protein
MTLADLITLNGAYARYCRLMKKKNLTLKEEEELFKAGDACQRLGLDVLRL